MQRNSNFLIAAPSSGTGKTTLTLGLLRAIKNRGIKVQPFKCGPDYIDTKFHEKASGNPAVNLDLFLSSTDHVQSLFAKYSSQADVSIVEGVMGLFDGYDRMKGSSAEVAEALQIPVILVVNAKAAAYSVAPLIAGFKNFSDQVKITGVIFNFVGSESHYRFLEEACIDVGVEPLGYLPKTMDIEIPSRHLGLTLEEDYLYDDFANKTAAMVEKYIHVDRLLEITQTDRLSYERQPMENESGKLRIAVAKDEAFNFMYHENIESLKRLGDVVFFSPLRDEAVPEADLVCLPGGYPELYAKELSENVRMKQSVRSYAEAEGRIWAECGGMMYLSSAIINQQGESYSMVGIFDQTATMQNMKLRLGYRQFMYNNCLFKGHEFHYSSIDSALNSVAEMKSAKGAVVDGKLLRYKNVLAGYTHLYWAEYDHIMKLF